MNYTWGACRNCVDTGKWQPGFPIAFIAGVLAVHQISAPVPDWIILLIIFPALGLMFWQPARYLSVLLLAAGWTLWHFNAQLDDRLDASLIGTTILVDGMVAELPDNYGDYTRFRFQPLESTVGAPLPESILAYWYRERPLIKAGQRWSLELQLSPPWGRVNFQGGDREKWLFSNRIGGLATVRSGELLSPPSWASNPLMLTRSLVREKIQSLLINDRARGVVLALSIADRSGLLPGDRQLMMSTGTSHLLAISGLHIGLAAVGGTWLARLLLASLPFLPFTLLGFRTTLACGLLIAVCYAALAGWGISTQRAVLMIGFAVVTIMLTRSVSPSRAWLLALCLVLIFDPLAPLGAGFWFSFLAVAILMFMFIPRTGSAVWWKTILLAQTGIMLAMLPVSLYWFQMFSPLGFFANMVAIPWLSLIIVPLTLTGICGLLISEALATVLLSMAAKTTLILLGFLEWLVQLQGPLPLFPSPGLLTFLLACLGGFLLLLPSAVQVRWVGVFLMLPLFMPSGQRTERGSLVIEALDVGQGTALLLSTAEHTLLYDSGPGDGVEFDLVNSVITPALVSLGGSAPERIVISHGDLDHAGGVSSLADRYPDAHWSANLAHPTVFEDCRAGLHWTWDGYSFDALHPSAGLPYLGNDSSCVISVSGTPGSILLTGDISSSVEQRLIDRSVKHHRVLLVPHHGSSGSSSEEFVSTVLPEIAIATNGLGNRFGFPRIDVKNRYQNAGGSFWSSGECGALRIEIKSDGTMQAQSARRIRSRPWRWPPAEDCP